MSSSGKKRLFLIDGHAMVYRAHFAMIRNPLITTDGRHTSALFGFINSMFKILRDENPEYIAIVFDSREKTFRHEMYPEYKATREKMPDELREQFPHLWRLVDAMNIPRLEMPGYEADDIIGSLASMAKNEGIKSYIVSGDKDFMQLVDEDIQIYSPGRLSKPTIIYDREKVIEKWGVTPEQIIDLLGLMGDSSDNVPGVAGVGKKNAVKLIEEYGSIGEALDHAEEVKNKRVREGLINGREVAILSRELVTILTDLPLSTSVDELERTDFNFDDLEDIFRDLEFFRLEKQLNDFRTDKVTSKIQEKNYMCVDNIEKLKLMLESLKSAKLISMDIETTSKDPMRAEIVGLSFSIGVNEGWYIPIQFLGKDQDLFGEDDLDYVLSELKPIYEDPQIQKCGQNIKYDLLVLKNSGIEVQGVVFDTMIAAHLLKPELRSYPLGNLSIEYLNYRMQPISDLIGTGKDQKSMADVPLKDITHYAVEDADIVYQLVPILKRNLKDSQLIKFFNMVEMPLVPVLVQMEYNGVYVDKDFMGDLSIWMDKKLDAATQEIYSLAGTEFNINSPQQLAQVLFDILHLPKIRKRSTNVNVLEKLKSQHPVPEKILEYRKFQKLKSTYADAIPRLIHSKTGRIHSSFSQTIATTGRLASSNPNFQNIPVRTEEGREIRKAFRPQREGWIIFSADYSQIELRVMAHLSGDESLREAFQKGEDIHSRTASNIYGVSLEDVLPEMRRTAKVVNFGVMYGAGPFRMSQELGIPMGEAQKVIDTYFNQYPCIKDFIDQTLHQAREKKFVQTMLGRRRYCYDINSSNQRIRSAVERAAINMPIQGTAAEMIKLAMIKIHDRMRNKNYKAKMILQIHDELLFEIPEDEFEDLKDIVIYEMENAMELDIPIVVDCGIGNSWYEAH